MNSIGIIRLRGRKDFRNRLARTSNVLLIRILYHRWRGFSGNIIELLKKRRIMERASRNCGNLGQ